MNKQLLSLMLLVVLAGCASFQPRGGMSYQEFRKMSIGSVNGEPQFIRSVGTCEIYMLRNSNRDLAPTNFVARAFYNPNRDFGYVFKNNQLIDTITAPYVTSYRANACLQVAPPPSQPVVTQAPSAQNGTNKIPVVVISSTSQASSGQIAGTQNKAAAPQNFGKGTASTSSRSAPLRVGQTYTYYDDGSCRGEFCLTKDQAITACAAIKGITKGFRNSLAPYGLSSAKRAALVEGGAMNSYDFKWNYGHCHGEVSMSGIYKGSSARSLIEGKVVEFVVNSNNEILAHRLDTFGWGAD